MEDRLDHLIMQLVAFSGLSAESMTREAGWLLLDIGRRLERALGLISLVRATLVPHRDGAVQRQLMETVLVICDSLNTFRRRYRSYMHLPTVLELILMDPQHPRSLAYQLEQLQRHIADLPRSQRPQRLGEDERCILEAYTELRLADVVTLSKIAAEEGVCKALDDLLAGQSASLWQLSDVITGTYFSHSQPPQQLVAAAAGRGRMKYRVIHTTEFLYEARVGLCYNEARLLPRLLPQQQVIAAALQIDPPPNDHYERCDYFGNRTVYFSLQQPHERLTVTATSEVETGLTTCRRRRRGLLPGRRSGSNCTATAAPRSSPPCNSPSVHPLSPATICWRTMPAHPFHRAALWSKRCTT